MPSDYSQSYKTLKIKLYLEQFQLSADEKKYDTDDLPIIPLLYNTNRIMPIRTKITAMAAMGAMGKFSSVGRR